MFKRAVSLSTLAAFLVFTFSCTIHKTVATSPGTLFQSGAKDFEIRAVLTKSGERIEFPEGRYGHVSGDKIVSFEAGTIALEISESDVQKMSLDAKGRVSEITTKDGKTYHPLSSERKGEKISIVYRIPISIPISDVDMVWVQKIDGGLTFLTYIGGAVIVLGVVAVIVALTKESCPFVYSYDGKGYVLDAEPYGGATAPALKRTEWCGLRHLKETQGRYKLKITNEVIETQYTDELKLVVVDHPRGVAVVPDEWGGLHTAAAPVPPVKATDGRGNDILASVKDDDWVFWQTKEREVDPESQAGLKDRLVFEFPKPAGATRAKLLFNGCNTLWASQMVKRFLALNGKNLPDYYASLTSSAAVTALQAWNLREELYRLRIRVETPNGWASKGTIIGGGPFVSREKAYSLDISDVPGETLRIELTPPAGFWMINALAMDYSDDVPLEPREIEAVSAVDSNGVDIRPLLAATDGRTFAMPNTGDNAELIFPAPPRSTGMERTVFLKASGYYDIHMGALGEPQLDTLMKIRSEPGYASKYAWGEYLRWQQEIRAERAR